MTRPQDILDDLHTLHTLEVRASNCTVWSLSPIFFLCLMFNIVSTQKMIIPLLQNIHFVQLSNIFHMTMCFFGKLWLSPLACQYSRMRAWASLDNKDIDKNSGGFWEKMSASPPLQLFEKGDWIKSSLFFSWNLSSLHGTTDEIHKESCLERKVNPWNTGEDKDRKNLNHWWSHWPTKFAYLGVVLFW